MDKEVSAAGYLITFFNDIESLTNSFGLYANLLADLKGKYPDKENLSKLPDEEKSQVLSVVRDARFWLNRTYVKFSALKENVKEFKSNDKVIDALYNELVKQAVPDFDKLQSYVIELNKLFVLGIVSTLLTKAYDIYAQFSGKSGSQ